MPSLQTCLGSIRNRHFFVLDFIALCCTPFIALFLRLENFSLIKDYLPALLTYTSIALVLRLVVFHYSGLYNRYWRYASVYELGQTFTAVLFSSLLIAIVFVAGRGLGIWGESLANSLPFRSGLLMHMTVDSLLVLLFVGGSRFSIRWAYSSHHAGSDDDARRVLIYGAGETGQRIVRELSLPSRLQMKPIGFLDDDIEKQGQHIHNLSVLGGREALPQVVDQHRIDQVIIAMPGAPGKTIREIVDLCEQVGVPTKIVPGMAQILENKVSVVQLRDVDIEDLLRREPVQTDISAVRALIRGKRVLITGGGGSIGSELCRQVLRCAPRHLALMGHGENSVFEVQNELQGILHQAARESGIENKELAGVRLQAIIADIRFPERIRNVLEDVRPDIIFHAAAHKHVPLMEMNPSEAITNNVFGTKNLLDAALAAGIERFVMISTDKAVNPTSVMGTSKRVAEMLVLRAAQRSGKQYVAVRFGNVLGSRGSVVPTFKRQILAGGPITVSHPDMRRYFMTIPEAVQLVLQAAVQGQGGEIFMLDMGEPVRIVDLARDLVELSGLQVGRDVDIAITGIRPGEKLFEEMFIPGETYEPTHHEKILIARNACSFVSDRLDTALTQLWQSVREDDNARIIRTLKMLVPEFTPDEALWGEAVTEEAVIEVKPAAVPSPSLASATARAN
jgi:FlaA1/EpsC-like NDP-sugar epimerase